MDTLLQDFRYAVRGLRRSPAFTVVALLTLALGIGVNASIFGVVNAILFKPLAVQRPQELVEIYGKPTTEDTHATSSYLNYVDYRQQTQTLADLIGYSNFFTSFSLSGSSEVVVGELVTDNYFQALGVRPALGRTFDAQEASGTTALPVAVISHRFWQKRFGGDPSILGRTFRLNGQVFTVIGVAPEQFGGLVPAVTSQLWIPIGFGDKVEPLGANWNSARLTSPTRLGERARHWMWMKGRMKPGVTATQVRTEFATMTARLAAAYPETNGQVETRVVPSRDVRVNPDVDGTIRAAGFVLIGAVGMVLIVACANLANLTLARAAGRRRELAVRVALGAARGRVVSQLFTESILLSLLGGAIAVPLAAWLGNVIMRVQPPLPLDLGLRVGADWRVLAFTFAAALLTGIVFGLIPALRASRPQLVPALKGSALGRDGGRRRIEARDALVVVQMAVSVVLVVVGAMMARSLGVAAKVNLGYDSDRIAVLTLGLEMNGYDRARAAEFLQRARLQLERQPGVMSVSFTSRAPLQLNDNGFGLFIDGRQKAATDAPFRMGGTYVDEHYATTLGLRMVTGRWIERADRENGQRVVVVSRAMASRYWPGESPLGKEIRLRWGADPYRVVGVVEDYRVDTPGEQPKPYLHLPFAVNATYADILVRTRSNAATALPAVVGSVRELDPNLVFLSTNTLRGMSDVRLFPVRVGAWLIGAFGLLALVVASVGLYGVVAYSVSRRVREIGIRKALGAQQTTLVGMVLTEGMILVGVGGAIGSLIAAGFAQVLSGALFVPAFDVISFAMALAVLGLVALIANAIPARRAARVDPMIALRHD